MSKGPGRIMRAAIAELEAKGRTEPFSVALRAHHDQLCSCDSSGCSKGERHSPTRAELVSARRALHALARRGVVELGRLPAPFERYRVLIAKRCPVAQLPDEATLTAVESL
jgi:hypothetical protein